jgi:general secretion pathway protein K
VNRGRQRGVALLAAVLVVALATILIAALLDRSEATFARTRNTLRAEQGWELMRGVEGWAADALRQDFQNEPGIDSAEDMWAQQLPPIDLPGVRIFARLRQASGCLNLNDLHHDGADDEVAIARMERLLRALKLNPAIAAQIADWIDADPNQRQQGAEDSAYATRRPPYRAANRPFVHVSELRLLAAMTPESYSALAPHVCALPAGSALNLNFAGEAVWMSLAEQITPSIAQRLAREGHARYESIERVQQELQQLGIPPLPLAGFGTQTDWFVLEARIVSDGVPFMYSSQLLRRGREVYVVARSRGVL